MRRGASFLIVSVFSTTTLSWPGSAQDGYASVRTAYAPARDEAPSNGAVESVGPAIGRDDEEGSGNPLWAVPLSAFVEIRERPLFSSSRRPPPSAPPAAAPPPAAEAVVKTKPEPPPWALIGTIVSPAASLAIVQNLGTQAVSRIRLGEEESGWRVRSVGARSIMVEKGPEAFTLELPRLPERDQHPAAEERQADGKRPRH